MAGQTWFSKIEVIADLEAKLGQAVGDSLLYGKEVTDVHQVTIGLLVFGIVSVLAIRFRSSIRKDPQKGLIPKSRFGFTSVFEVITEYTYGTMAGIMGEKAARHFLPFIGTFAFFIMFSNLIGLVPGFLPPTDSLNTTIPCAVLVFFATHIYGIKENGIEHIKHMCGPVLVLAPLVLVIETISHIARPISLGLRLAGNMIGDHKAVSIFLGLVPILVPIPLLGLGIIVCLVQTLVFCLLSTVYIGMAIEHHDHAEGH